MQLPAGQMQLPQMAPGDFGMGASSMAGMNPMMAMMSMNMMNAMTPEVAVPAGPDAVTIASLAYRHQNSEQEEARANRKFAEEQERERAKEAAASSSQALTRACQRPAIKDKAKSGKPPPGYQCSRCLKLGQSVRKAGTHWFENCDFLTTRQKENLRRGPRQPAIAAPPVFPAIEQSPATSVPASATPADPPFVLTTHALFLQEALRRMFEESPGESALRCGTELRCRFAKALVRSVVFGEDSGCLEDPGDGKVLVFLDRFIEFAERYEE